MSENNSLKAYILRFFTVGIAATSTYFIVANLLMHLDIVPAALCSVLAYIIGIVISFLGQRSYTFQINKKKQGQLMRFCILSIIGLYISYLSVDYAVNVYQVSALWGTIITSMTIPLLSFWVMKIWVFNK